jgi:peptidoglycan lytic transglycosylase
MAELPVTAGRANGRQLKAGTASGNQQVSVMNRHVLVGAWILIAATLAVPGCAPGSAGALPAAAPKPKAAAPVESPSQAFVEGYRAYRRQDLDTAVNRLSYAASRFPPLADYALFYLGLAERDRNNLPEAEQTLSKLISRYPQSVTVPGAELALAQVQLERGMAGEAVRTARRAVALAPDAAAEQTGRLELARALAADGDAPAAYNELMVLRQRYPRGRHDADARTLAYSILTANPGVAPVNTAQYHHDEAALLLKEGKPAMALEEARLGFALSPAPPLRARLVFLEARALKPLPRQAEAAFKQYLRIAPAGLEAPAAMQALALIYWNEDRRELARATFARLVEQFPNSALAPGAMLRMGRISEEEKDFDAARRAYLRLIARYPRSEAADDARFRAPWMYYMTGRYALAAEQFAAMRARAPVAHGERAMFAYWYARALEKSGRRAAAKAIYTMLAASIASNYYPALAAQRVHAHPPVLPAATIPDPSFDVPSSLSKSAAFHVDRVLVLERLGLSELAPAELRTLAGRVGEDPALGNFVLAGFQRSNAYYDAIIAAGRMERRGELDHDAAERVRYPRAYWHLIAPAAAANHLDPYLVLALARQESLFNSKATSGSDARGLMQLMPSTAERLAGQTRGSAGPGDLYDPALNVKLGTRELARLFALFHGNEVRAVAAYNAGQNAVNGWIARFGGDNDQWVENIGFHETRNYVKRVIGGMREYRLLYPPHHAVQASRKLPASRDGRARSS